MFSLRIRLENYAQNKKKVRAYMYKLITLKKIKHLKQISYYNEFSKSHEAFMWTFNIFQGFCTTNVFTGVAIGQML